MMVNKKGLGKGLGALLASEDKTENLDTGCQVIEVDINKIEPNKDQPRKKFKEESLIELSESIKQFGIIQPITVNKADGYYKIIAGERRWRAARLANLNTVPVIVRTYDDLKILQIALIENIQREDLNPIEEALCYQKLCDIFFFKKEDIAKKVGKSRNTIGSTMSLLSLDLRVQNLVAEGKLLLGQAKKLIYVEDKELQFNLAENIIDNELSLKDTESLIENILNKKEEVIEKKNTFNEKTKKYKTIEENLSSLLGTNVNIKNGKHKGKIEIDYYSEEDLDRLLCIFNAI